MHWFSAWAPLLVPGGGGSCIGYRNNGVHWQAQWRALINGHVIKRSLPDLGDNAKQMLSLSHCAQFNNTLPPPCPSNNQP